MDKSQLTGVERIKEYRDTRLAILAQLEALPPEQQNPVQINLLKLMVDTNNRTIDCAENHKPMICTWYGNAQEIPAAMGIHSFNPVFDFMFHLGCTDNADLVETDKYPLDDKICSLIRYATYTITEHLHPRPDAFIGMMEPCDGELMLDQAIHRSEHWKGVPMYSIDPSYGHEPEDFEYVAKQLKEMIQFLVEKTGAKYDFAKLQALVEETNKQYEIWKECNEYMRATPAPMPSFVIPDVFWALTQHLPTGDPRCTALMGAVRDVAKENVEKGVGPVMNEQIRILWTDLDPLWGEPLAQWLAEEWNAVIVQTFQGNTPYTRIDTSTEESTLFGLARRSVAEVPMIRQGRGWVDVVLDDCTQMINDFNINCVMFSGHMGHKDQSGIGYFLQKLCRDMNVPLYTGTCSLFDSRYTPLDKLKNDLANFFSAAGFKKAKKIEL